MKKLIVNIEITKGSNIKYEYNRETNKIEVDRILRDGFTYPANYGFLAEALDWDGDELDVLVYSENTFLPGSSLKGRLVGAMEMIDDGEVDTKLIVVHDDDYKLESIQELSDVPQKWLDDVKKFFSTYKNWKRAGITDVTDFQDHHWAEKEYLLCVELMKKYGSLKKNEFITKMKTLHPEKYPT